MDGRSGGSDYENHDTVTTYARRLGAFSAAMAVVGGIIGSGIFVGPAVVAQRVGTSNPTR
jgi:amino acid transporter